MDQATYSYVNMILLSLVGGIFVTIAGMIGFWWRDINTRINHLTQAEQDNTSIIRQLLEWSKGHDKQDDSRHADTTRRLDRQFEELVKIRVGDEADRDRGRH